MSRFNIELENINNVNHQPHRSRKSDRLSFLPDNLLITILSLMPISSAVATSVLSHRWRHLWTYLTHVSFRFSSPYANSFLKFQNCVTAINHVVSRLTSPKIHTFRLVLPFTGTQNQVCSTLLVPTLHEICLRNPEVIKIVVCRDYLCLLSTSLFKTQSLVELCLDSVFEFDFGIDAPVAVNLPRLKSLRISLCDSNRHLMHTLFKSCPLLEHLYLCLNLKKNDHHVDIIAPNLKSLTIECPTNYFLSIDAPMLVNLKTFGYGSVSYHFVKNLRCLQEAEIMIPDDYVEDGYDYIRRILALFQGISCATSLAFNGCFDDILLDVALPSFPNLVDLKFDCYLLDSSSWMPSCLLSNVKIIRIFDMNPNDYGIRVLQDILRNGTVLEQLHVSHCENYMKKSLKIRVWKEYEFAMKLFKLPRSSSSCRIELSGDIVTASCKDFRNRKLTCQLEDLTL